MRLNFYLSLALRLLFLSISFLGNAQSIKNLESVYSITDFGAVGDGVIDNTMQIQKAIDVAAEKGGKVYFPAGKFLVNGSIKVKQGVSVIGTNEAPLSPYQLTGTVIFATGGRDDEGAEPLFELWNSSSVKGFTVFYPDQRHDDIHPYPWTFYIKSNSASSVKSEKRVEDFNVTIQNITLINSYNGIKSGPEENGRHIISNVHGCVLRRGIFVDWVGDVGRIENVHFHCHFWSQPATNGNWTNIFKYMQQNLEAFIFGHSDWEFVTNTFVFPAKIGYKFIQTENGSCNGQFSGIAADATETCLLVESIQSQGLFISNGQFNSHKVGISTQLIVEKSCEGNIRFGNCGFWGKSEHCAQLFGKGNVSFQNCYFSSNYISTDPKNPNYSIIAEEGKLQVNNCTFDGSQLDEKKQWNYTGEKRQQPSIYLKPTVKYAIIVNNTGYKGVSIKNEIGKRAIIRDNESVPH